MRKVAGLPEELQPAVSAYQRPWLRRQSASARDVAPVASAGGSSKGGGVSTTPLIAGSQAASVGSKAIGTGPGSNSLGSPKVGSKATTSSGTGPAQLPARLNTVPELPIPRKSLDRSTPGKFLKFFRENRSAYPTEIRDLIDKVPLKNPPKAKLRAIDKAIRDLHTAEANRLAGFANAAEKPFINSQRAVSNEGGELASLLTDEKVLSLKGQIPGGGTAEFDSVEFVGSGIHRGEAEPELDQSDRRDCMEVT